MFFNTTDIIWIPMNKATLLLKWISSDSHEFIISMNWDFDNFREILKEEMAAEKYNHMEVFFPEFHLKCHVIMIISNFILYHCWYLTSYFPEWSIYVSWRDFQVNFARVKIILQKAGKSLLCH